ncbi:fat storage-inducing transmembrane protein [Chelonus insularis]|uniref:fat storage-inducing transmembrane protein n=1 Tax=Chelonus insularis TaxID=460826 RepID=UPI00158D25EF|nr:fat storage-inducing transmembrane protein [Chelonus insularis]
MAPTKRRPLHANLGIGATGGSFRSRNMNFRPAARVQEDRGGTKPTTTPSSIGLVLVTMLLHLCRKSLLFNIRLKVAIYIISIFTISLIADFMPIPKTYFARSDNVFNRYFVKWGWGWLLTVTIPWVALTAHTIGCGRRSILVKHLLRLVIATFAWFVWVKTFNFIETHHGRCLNTRDPELQTKVKCLQAGKFWNGLDISGHTFILVYSNLILAEEGSSLIGWEGIKDWIMREEHSRSLSEVDANPLRNLSNDDLEILKKAHKILTPYLRGLFVVMTLQQMLWDVMLASTLLYYHIMVEKFIGGIIAILTWYVTYRWWYKMSLAGIMAPGEGLFKYNEMKEQQNINAARTRRNTLNGSTPKFMGMPIRTQQPDVDESKNSKPDTQVST